GRREDRAARAAADRDVSRAAGAARARPVPRRPPRCRPPGAGGRAAGGPRRRRRGVDAPPLAPRAGASHGFGRRAGGAQARISGAGSKPRDQHHRLEVAARGDCFDDCRFEGRARAHPRAGAERRMTPLLLILSAPSGTGKTTLARRLVAGHPGALFSVSYTTRPPRGDEKDGVDYHFVSRERFQQMIAEGAFLEWAQVHGDHYGTPRTSIATGASLVVFDIDVQGGQAIKKQHPEAVRALILPPSLAELERRLRARSTDDDATVRRRLHA